MVDEPDHRRGARSVIVVVVAAVATGLAVELAPGRTRQRVQVATEPPAVTTSHEDEQAVLRRMRPLLCVLAFAAGWAFVGGIVGLVIGVGVAGWAWRVLGATESPSERRRRVLLAAQLPTGVQLLAACLAAGTAVEPALEAVAAALPGPVGDRLLHVGHELRLGVDPADVWGRLGADASLGALGRAFGRAHETGAAIAEVLTRLGDDLRREARLEVEQRAKTLDVRASAPLGICFLPGFLVLGVVPMMAGIVSTMHLFH